MRTKKTKRIMKGLKDWYMGHMTYIWKYRKGITRKSRLVSVILMILVTITFPLIAIMETSYVLCSLLQAKQIGHFSKFDIWLSNHFRMETID